MKLLVVNYFPQKKISQSMICYLLQKEKMNKYNGDLQTKK